MLTILSQHFAGRGFPIQAALVWFVGLGVNLAINLAFLSSGTYVAALASTIAYAVLLVLHVRMFAREIGGLAQCVLGLVKPSPWFAVASGARDSMPRADSDAAKAKQVGFETV